MQARIRAAINELRNGPTRGDTRKLQGEENIWRLRVGEWRVRFTPDFTEKAILVLRILPRGRAYRD
jgi:mRNA interferase RelE/StbE